ncbi:hypothetical protein ACFCV8_07330 [Streptomyces sp. NPDC056347]|uniref:hypothetical protein n=1 Tax=Streptomyces sp. NPDC056347 TaxID=3345790 RepID=UPI0035E1B792
MNQAAPWTTGPTQPKARHDYANRAGTLGGQPPGPAGADVSEADGQGITEGLHKQHNHYRTENMRGWWDKATKKEREQRLADQRDHIVATVARTLGVDVDPTEVTYTMGDEKGAGPCHTTPSGPCCR